MNTPDTGIDTAFAKLVQGLGPVDRPIAAARVIAAAGRRQTRFRAFAAASAVGVVGLAVGVTAVTVNTFGGSGVGPGVTGPSYAAAPRKPDPVMVASLAKAVGDGTIVASGQSRGHTWTVRGKVVDSLEKLENDHPGEYPGLPPIGQAALFTVTVDGTVIDGNFGPLTPNGFQVLGRVWLSIDPPQQPDEIWYYGSVRPGAERLTLTYDGAPAQSFSTVQVGGTTLAAIAVPQGIRPTSMTVYKGGKAVDSGNVLVLGDVPAPPTGRRTHG